MHEGGAAKGCVLRTVRYGAYSKTPEPDMDMRMHGDIFLLQPRLQTRMVSKHVRCKKLSEECKGMVSWSP